MTTQADFYADPQVYDVLHAPGTATDVRVLLRMAKQFSTCRGGPLWLEPACGTGRYLIAAARAGVRAVGFDLSPAMVAYAFGQAERKGLGKLVRFYPAAMESFADEGAIRPRTVSFAFNLINTIRHLETDRAMLAHFAEVARVLRPGAAYAVGVSLSAYGLESITEDTWSGRRGGLAVSQVVQYIPPGAAAGDVRRSGVARVERVISHLTIQRGSREGHVDSTYALRCYNLAQWKALIDRSALRIEAVTDGDGRPAEAREPGYFVFILRT